MDGEVVHTQLNVQFQVFPLAKPGIGLEFREKGVTWERRGGGERGQDTL